MWTCNQSQLVRYILFPDVYEVSVDDLCKKIKIRCSTSTCKVVTLYSREGQQLTICTKVGKVGKLISGQCWVSDM